MKPRPADAPFYAEEADKQAAEEMARDLRRYGPDRCCVALTPEPLAAQAPATVAHREETGHLADEGHAVAAARCDERTREMGE